jgi:hypothetical protein
MLLEEGRKRSGRGRTRRFVSTSEIEMTEHFEFEHD